LCKLLGVSRKRLLNRVQCLLDLRKKDSTGITPGQEMFKLVFDIMVNAWFTAFEYIFYKFGR